MLTSYGMNQELIGGAFGTASELIKPLLTATAVLTCVSNETSVTAASLFTHRLNAYCKRRGWQRIYDNRREDYILKWCETKFRDAYYNFREGKEVEVEWRVSVSQMSTYGLERS